MNTENAGTGTSSTISLLYDLMAHPEKVVPTQEAMIQSGISGDEAAMIEEMIQVTRQNFQQLQLLSDQANKPLLEMQLKNAISMQDEYAKSGKKTMELVAD